MKRIVIFASGSGSNAENIIKFFNQTKTARVTKVFCNNENAKVLDRCKKLNINFIVCHKECVCFEEFNKIKRNHWKENMGKCYASAVSVYNDYTKQSMSFSGVIQDKKIKVVGMSRADEYFNLKTKKLKKNFILFLMIEEKEFTSESFDATKRISIVLFFEFRLITW